MGLPSAYSRKAISGNEIKNDSSTLLNAGNVNPALANNITLAENTPDQLLYGSQVTASVSPTSSGNTGIGLAISNGTVNRNTDGNYIATMLGTKIAGVTTSVMRQHYGIPGDKTNRFHGYRRLGRNSWDYQHVITKGGNAGEFVASSGIDGRTGASADDALLYPGEFTEHRQGPNPTNDEFNG